MASLRLAMDAAFWDVSVSSPQTLEGSARSVPGEPVPLMTTPVCRTLRPQQLSLLGLGFPLGILPSFSPTSPEDLGSFSLHSLLLKYEALNWWVGLIGQFRPKKLISSLKAEMAGSDELELPAFKDISKHFLNKSLYSIGLCSQFSLSPASSLYVTTERHGEKKGHRTKAMYYHKLPYHDVTLEAAWPELFVDKNGAYWDVPESISLDLASLVSESGLRYRFGIHKNTGIPRALNAKYGDVPLALLPGLLAKAAFSYEKRRDIWRQKMKKKDMIVKTDKGRAWWFSYDSRLMEPHAAISGIIGGVCTAWFGGNAKSVGDLGEGKPQPLSVDLFGSLGFSFQQGRFRKRFGDLTRLDAHIDICSASAFVKGARHLVSNFFKGHVEREVNPLAAPKLNMAFQQQIMGPIVFRVESRLSPSEWYIPRVEDIVYSLSYSLLFLESGKILAWYSPKRKEGMIEIRVYEF